MKTSELKDGILDWAVDKALNINTPYNSWGQKGKVPFYSTDWAQGGPIIAREGLCVQPYCGLYEYNPIVEWESFVMARCFENKHPHGIGSTPLVAAMRCFVAIKLGDEVDVPDDVLRDAELDDLIYDRGDE